MKNEAVEKGKITSLYTRTAHKGEKEKEITREEEKPPAHADGHKHHAEGNFSAQQESSPFPFHAPFFFVPLLFFCECESEREDFACLRLSSVQGLIQDTMQVTSLWQNFNKDHLRRVGNMEMSFEAQEGEAPFFSLPPPPPLFSFVRRRPLLSSSFSFFCFLLSSQNGKKAI